ncbi:MAG TPA: T9SS type A sorting domain-containing protein [Chitinophagales bacterium]|nr:T9SS type A sorting domain-containing protein [Chitinophagales bacterium]
MPRNANRILHVILLVGIWCLSGLSNLRAQTAPDAVNDTIAICVGEPVIIDLLANDSDADGDPLETDIISGPVSPLIDYDDDGLPEGSYLIDIESDFIGTDYIIYEVCGDDDDLCAIAVLVIIVGGEEGCVWPGDANLDSICNVIDLLPIGLYFGEVGPTRTDADGGWEETFCEDWGDVPGLELYSNPKFADCNGDGVINAEDTTILMSNYGQLRGAYVPLAFVGGLDDPELVPGVFGDTLPAGTEVVIPIYYGSDETPATDVYGIAFSIDYDETVIDPQSVYIHFDASWLGDVGEDLIFLQYNDTLNGVLEVSATRTNQISRAGSGHFATMGFVMEDNIAGKTTGTIYAQTTLCMEQPLAINALGLPMPTRISCDTFVIADGSQVITNSGLQTIRIFPNPAQATAYIDVADINGQKYIQLQTITGQIVFECMTNENRIEIPVSGYASGSYMVQIIAAQNKYTQQLIIQH